jgi:conjugative transposon TraN protein
MRTIYERLPHQFWVVTTALMLVLVTSANAQRGNDTTHIVVTFNKTTSIVFPATIKSVDRGSRDVLAQKATGIENILHLKAARQYFPETNLTVITEGSVLHELTVNYSKDPQQRVYHLSSSTIGRAVAFESKLTSYQLDQYAQRIIRARPNLVRRPSRENRMRLDLKTIHVRDNVLFFHLQIANRSNISYSVQYARMYVRDKVQARRTASQENTVDPLLIKGNLESVAGQSREDLIYATDKFTIPKSKRIYIEVYENNGGRNLKLKLKNKRIVRARLLP